MKKPQSKLVLKKETLRDLMVRNEARVRGGKKSYHPNTKKCATFSC